MVLRILLMLAMSCSVVKAQVALAADSASGLPGSQVEVPVRAFQWVDIVSCQGTIAWDTAVIALDSVFQFGLPGMNPTNFGQSLVPGGKLTYSWNEPNLQGTQVPDSTVLFNLRFDLIGQGGTSSPVSFSSNPTTLEFVDGNFAVLPFSVEDGRVEIEDTTSVHVGEVKQVQVNVYPNPIVLDSKIEWEGDGSPLPWRLIDVSGATVNSGIMESPFGFNRESWSHLNMPFLPAGIYWIQWGNGKNQRLSKVLIDNKQ